MPTPLTFHAFRDLRRFHPDGREHPNDQVRDFCAEFSAPVPVLTYDTEFGCFVIYVWSNIHLEYETVVYNESIVTPDLEKAERFLYDNVDIDRLD